MSKHMAETETATAAQKWKYPNEANYVIHEIRQKIGKKSTMTVQLGLCHSDW
jgi:hypothetical protein